ncbi:MAG: hypothetical protein JRJ87_09745 [Deltaproteobacteria bacterium]|nr:hypothetical protein [Deltaproteobacteria bacterium]
MQQLQEQERKEPEKQLDQILNELRYQLSAIEGYTQIVKQTIGGQHPVHSKILEIEKAASRAAAATRNIADFIENSRNSDVSQVQGSDPCT